MEQQIGLNKLRCGERAAVRELRCAESIRRRLREIGLIPDTVITCVGRSPFGDPAAYEIRGAVIAIRDADASRICVERLNDEGGAEDGTA